MKNIETYLDDPRADISLDQLAVELNELAKIRHSARIAFCKRLAVAYLMIVGHMPKKGSSDGGKFYKWCAERIRSGNGKAYTFSTLRTYLRVGFAKDPAKLLRQTTAFSNKREQETRSLGAAVQRAVADDDPPKVVPIKQLRDKYKLPTDVAREVNALMTAWEQASSQARSQFIYMVTGKRTSVAA